jgi:hypothetical protein
MGLRLVGVEFFFTHSKFRAKDAKGISRKERGDLCMQRGHKFLFVPPLREIHFAFFARTDTYSSTICLTATAAPLAL